MTPDDSDRFRELEKTDGVCVGGGLAPDWLNWRTGGRRKMYTSEAKV